MSRQIIDWDTIVSHCVCVHVCVCVCVCVCVLCIKVLASRLYKHSYISKEKVKPILKIVSFLKYPLKKNKGEYSIST